MRELFFICVAGSIGTAARYLLSGLAFKFIGPAFPYGTLGVNLLGSFLIGAINYFGFHGAYFSPETRVVLAAGLMGGFTTYSSFNYETLQFFQQGNWGLGMLNVFGTLFGCLVAGMAGLFLAKWWVS